MSQIASMAEHPHIYEYVSQEKPLVVYFPGFNGMMTGKNAVKTQKTALMAGCSYLAFNPIALKEGDAPNVYHDFGLAVDNIKKFLSASEIEQQVKDNAVFVFNSWSARPALEAIRDLGVEPKNVIGIGATLRAHEVFNAGMQAYIAGHFPGVEVKREVYESGSSVVVPYPPYSKDLIDINRSFMEAGRTHNLVEKSIRVSGDVFLFRGRQDEYVSFKNVEELDNIFNFKGGDNPVIEVDANHDSYDSVPLIQEMLKSVL